MEIPASLPKKKPRRKRTKPKASDVVPRKSARFASKVNQDQDQEAAESPAGDQEAAESPAVVDQEAAESPAAGGQETAAAESPDVGQEAAVHCEAIWGVMIALVFFAIFEPDDENKS